jgi:hypothetical protein
VWAVGFRLSATGASYPVSAHFHGGKWTVRVDTDRGRLDAVVSGIRSFTKAVNNALETRAALQPGSERTFGSTAKWLKLDGETIQLSAFSSRESAHGHIVRPSRRG